MKKALIICLPIIWMGVIFYSSSQPYQEQDIKPLLSSWWDFSFLIPFVDWVQFTYHHSEVSVEQLGIHGFIEFFIRKGAHVTVFLVLMLLFYFAYRTTQKIKKAIQYALLSTVSYAIFDEIHQGFTPNRTPFVGDVLLDTLGAFLVCICLFLFTKTKQR